MKKIKVLFLLLVLVLITGCSGTYNLKIDKDLSVKEELNVVLENEATSFEEFNSLLKNNKIDSNDYKLVTQGDNLNLSYSHEYNSIEEYLLESKVYKQLFDNISYDTDRKDFTLEAKNIFNLDNPNMNNSKNVKLLQINVTTPLYVIDENSDSISENTYSWTIDNKTKEKDLYIEFSVDDRKLNTGSIIILSTIAISSIILVIIIVKRILNSRKI